jgi:hypothetical protein
VVKSEAKFNPWFENMKLAWSNQMTSHDEGPVQQLLLEYSRLHQYGARFMVSHKKPILMQKAYHN